jgi:aminoglycoside phosphotransferase family enzyme/predicted kinase
MDDYPSVELLTALTRPAAYPDDASAGEGASWVQTHISHVFLTGERVYKLRKAVDLGFLRFASREQRNADCLREVALNRRLAPDVYLGVAPLYVEGGSVWVGLPAEHLAGVPREVPEHCVVMRRLAEGRDALSLVEAHALTPGQIDRLAACVAGFHARHGLGAPAPFSRRIWLERCTRPAKENLRRIAGANAPWVAREAVDRVAALARDFVRRHGGRFERRRQAGRAVDGHGDLHLQHVWFEGDDSAPLIIDCLEFNESLRRIDAAAEVAFPAMDLVYRGRRELAERFLRVYARERGDFDLYGVVDYFASYRSAVRAKVAVLAAQDVAIDAAQRERAVESAQRHLLLAARMLEPRTPGTVVLVGGVVGTGKSSVAEVLAEAVGGAPGAVVIGSDRVRKQLAGLRACQRVEAAPDEGLYTPEARGKVYAALLEDARAVVASGRLAVLDATWSRRADRARARALAKELGSRCLFIETCCAPAVALQRLARREAIGRDASDAGPALYATSLARFEAFDEDAEGERHRVVTDRPRWERDLAGLAARLRR